MIELSEMNTEKTEEEKIREVYEIDTNYKFKKSIISILLLLVTLTVALRIYSINYISSNKYAFKINNTKIERSVVDQLKPKYSNEEDIAFFVLETMLYANEAEKQGLSVSQEEINKIDSPVLQKELALKNKLILKTKEKTKNVSEKDLKEIYSKNKDLYVKSGNVTYVGVKSSTPLPYNYKFKLTDNRQRVTCSIEEMLSKGFAIEDLSVGKIIPIETKRIGSEYEYRYITVISRDNIEYRPYEECIPELKSKYDEECGFIHLTKFIKSLEESSTIQYYNS